MSLSRRGVRREAAAGAAEAREVAGFVLGVVMGLEDSDDDEARGCGERAEADMLAMLACHSEYRARCQRGLGR
jgi:hypothetical protein